MTKVEREYREAMDKFRVQADKAIGHLRAGNVKVAKWWADVALAYMRLANRIKWSVTRKAYLRLRARMYHARVKMKEALDQAIWWEQVANDYSFSASAVMHALTYATY